MVGSMSVGTIGQPLRVAFAESTPLLRFGARAVIGAEPTLSWAGCGDTAESVIDLCRSDDLDVLVVGDTDPEWRLCHTLTEMFRALAVVALLGRGPDAATAAMRARHHGVRGLVALDAPVPRLVMAIRQVAERGYYLDPDLGPLVPSQSECVCGPGAKPLTGREYEVLQLIAEGRTAEFIGRRLGITTDTVRTHSAHILRKLDARDRAHAVARAFEMSLLPPMFARGWRN